MNEAQQRVLCEHLACLYTHMRFFLAQAVRARHDDPQALAHVETMTDLVATGLVGILCAAVPSQAPPGLIIAELFAAFQPHEEAQEHDGRG